MKKLVCLIMALFMIFIIGGCQSGEDVQNHKLQIVAVSFPEYDFARAVAGDLAEIKMLIPPAGEVHGYEPTVSDIKAVSSCDLFIYTGGESDTWTESLIESAKNKNLKTLAMVDFAEHINNDEHNHDDKYTFDEHVQTSPNNAVSIVNAVKDALIEIDTENKKVELSMKELEEPSIDLASEEKTTTVEKEDAAE